MQNSWSDEEIGSKRIATPWEKERQRESKDVLYICTAGWEKKNVLCYWKGLRLKEYFKSFNKILIKPKFILSNFSQFWA